MMTWESDVSDVLMCVSSGGGEAQPVGVIERNGFALGDRGGGQDEGITNLTTVGDCVKMLLSVCFSTTTTTAVEFIFILLILTPLIPTHATVVLLILLLLCITVNSAAVLCYCCFCALVRALVHALVAFSCSWAWVHALLVTHALINYLTHALVCGLVCVTHFVCVYLSVVLVGHAGVEAGPERQAALRVVGEVFGEQEGRRARGHQVPPVSILTLYRVSFFGWRILALYDN